MKYQPVIGLEIHAELKTKTKMFCDSLNDPDEKHPNLNVCPICMGHPGTLPVVNEDAVKKVIMAGLALNCQIERDTFFERKNYFYPDLPKGYQISQYQKPLCYGGWLDIPTANRLQTTDYSNKNGGGQSAVDGKPILGTKVEVKNINSIKFAANAVDYEIKRQTELLDTGEKIRHETRGWDDKKGETYLMRTKEEAQDYRYFPEPDIPPLHFEDVDVEDIASRLPELPQQRRERFAKQYGLSERYVEIFVVNKQLGDYYEHVSSELDSSANDYHKKRGQAGDEPIEPHVSEKLHSLAANYIITEFPTLMNSLGQKLDMEGFKISPEAFAELMVLIFHKELSSTGAKAVLKEMVENGLHPEQIMKEKDLSQISDTGDLEMAVREVISENPKPVDDYKKGKEASVKFLIGKVMSKTKGKANPQIVEGMIKEMLK